MTILEMIEKRNKAWEAAKAFVETKRDKDGLLSEEDAVTYSEMEKKVKDYSAEIGRMQEQEAMERELERPVNTPIVTRPQKEKPAEVKRGKASEEYKKAILAVFRSNFRVTDADLNGYLSEGVSEEGGYLVPDEWDQRLIDVLDEENILRSLATKISTSGLHKINIAATKPAAAWIEEGEELSFTDATFDQIYLDAFKLHVAIKVTDELLYDNAFGLEDYIITQFGKALANAEEDAFLNGDGVGKPTGIFTTGTVADTVAAVDADSIISLVYALKRPYRKKASFIMNDKLLGTVRTLKDSTGAYIWQPSYQEGEPDRILGYEVHTSAFAPLDALAFGDYSYYNIGDRGTRSFSELRELFAGNGMVGFVARERVDGKLVLPEAVQILKIGSNDAEGTSTVSAAKSTRSKS